MADKYDRDYVDPDEPYDAEYTPLDDEADLEEDRYRGPLERRESGGIDLTSGWVRILATLIVIALGIAVILWALRPGDEETALDDQPTPEATTDAESAVVPTFTAGATITVPSDEVAGDATPEAADGETAPDGAPGGAIAAGDAVVVTGTDGLGVNLRESANTTSAIIEILQDDTPLTVVAGPEESEGFTWWQVSMQDGVQGWLVQDYLAPASP